VRVSEQSCADDSLTAILTSRERRDGDAASRRVEDDDVNAAEHSVVNRMTDYTVRLHADRTGAGGVAADGEDAAKTDEPVA
jgi:hypothetical protein